MSSASWLSMSHDIDVISQSKTDKAFFTSQHLFTINLDLVLYILSLVFIS